jgi:ferredoxin--NADP+ reductase
LDGTEMLYIDPQACIDCGACVAECPVEAIYSEDGLPTELALFKDLNAAFFERHPLRLDLTSDPPARDPVKAGSLRVAIVGSGPAASYAALELTDIDGVEVSIFERLPTPFGLIRSGVAPDHQATKSVVDVFSPALSSPRLDCYFNVEIGRDLTHADLLEHHHAVVYAVGATKSRNLGITGEHLSGNHAASDFVGWYNGHPDLSDRDFDLSAQRAVIIGNGNVALDIARVLLMDQVALAATDIAQNALETLSGSAVREVVILARRGLREAAFSVGEFLALGYLKGVDVLIDDEDLVADAANDDVELTYKLQIARQYAQRDQMPGNKRIVFRFHSSATELIGEQQVTGVKVDRNGSTELIETALVLQSIGYLGAAIDGLPYDAERGIIPNEHGRVVDGEDPVPGVYVTGWIKRGPRGVIGTNRACAHETIAQLWNDHLSGSLIRQVGDRQSLRDLVMARGIEPVGIAGWRAIDAAELTAGRAAARPRVKFVAIHDLLAAARN